MKIVFQALAFGLVACAQPPREPPASPVAPPPPVASAPQPAVAPEPSALPAPVSIEAPAPAAVEAPPTPCSWSSVSSQHLPVSTERGGRPFATVSEWAWTLDASGALGAARQGAVHIYAGPLSLSGRVDLGVVPFHSTEGVVLEEVLSTSGTNRVELLSLAEGFAEVTLPLPKWITVRPLPSKRVPCSSLQLESSRAPSDPPLPWNATAMRVRRGATVAVASESTGPTRLTLLLGKAAKDRDRYVEVEDRADARAFVRWSLEGPLLRGWVDESKLEQLPPDSKGGLLALTGTMAPQPWGTLRCDIDVPYVVERRSKEEGDGGTFLAKRCVALLAAPGSGLSRLQPIVNGVEWLEGATLRVTDGADRCVVTPKSECL